MIILHHEEMEKDPSECLRIKSEVPYMYWGLYTAEMFWNIMSSEERLQRGTEVSFLPCSLFSQIYERRPST